MSSKDIVDRLKVAIVELIGEDSEYANDGVSDPLVYEKNGCGVYVSDVMHDAIVEIKRLRAASAK